MKQFKYYLLLIASFFSGAVMISCIEEEEEEADQPEEYVDPHEYVDLGLPSGLKWATENVGALKPEEVGSYFSWGDVEEKDSYYWGMSDDIDKGWSFLMSFGIIDSLGNLCYSHDAASVNWGGLWRTPTETEFKELVDYCDWRWTSVNGINGYKVSSKAKDNHNSIFLPAGGRRVSSGSPIEYNEYGAYWCANMSDRHLSLYSTTFYFDKDSKRLGNVSLHYVGQLIRPVIE